MSCGDLLRGLKFTKTIGGELRGFNLPNPHPGNSSIDMVNGAAGRTVAVATAEGYTSVCHGQRPHWSDISFAGVITRQRSKSTSVSNKWRS